MFVNCSFNVFLWAFSAYILAIHNEVMNLYFGDLVTDTICFVFQGEISAKFDQHRFSGFSDNFDLKFCALILIPRIGAWAAMFLNNEYSSLYSIGRQFVLHCLH